MREFGVGKKRKEERQKEELQTDQSAKVVAVESLFEDET